MKKINKTLRITVSLILMMLLLSVNVCYAKKTDKNTTKRDVIDSVTINVEKCNITVEKYKGSKFKYEYNDKLFKITQKIEKNKLMIKVISIAKDNVENTWCDRAIIYIPNNLSFKKVNVENNKGAIGLCEINAEINIISNNGATSFYVPKNLSNTITYTSNKGSGSISFCKGANNYSVNLNKKDSAVSCTLPKYDPNSSTYKYVKGNGSAKINIDVKNSSFAVNVLK